MRINRVLRSSPAPANVRQVLARPPIRSAKRVIAANAASTTVTSDLEAHLAYLREQLVAHNLEAITPYMSELAVVKAVVRQHQAKLAWEKKEAQRAQEQQRYYSSQGSYDGYGSYNSYGADPAPSQHFVEDYNQFNYMPPCPVPGASPPSSLPHSSSSSGGSSYAWASSMNEVSSPHASPYSSSPAPSVAPRPNSPTPDSRSSNSTPRSAAASAAAAAAATPDFIAILDASQCGQDQHGQLMDSFAMRHLILSRPAQLEPLSSMMATPDTFVQRCLSTALWGEKCILTFTLKRRSELELTSTYSKQPHKQPWVLSRVCGEPVSGEPLEAISPEHPPEAIVAAQLQAFKDCDFDVAYALTSPVGRAVAGTRERFRASLQGDFRYQQLLMHQSATSVQRAHNAANTYLEVFNVEGLQGGSSLYIWVATRQLEGLYKNCWLVEYVTPVRDPEIVKVLQLGY